MIGTADHVSDALPTADVTIGGYHDVLGAIVIVSFGHNPVDVQGDTRMFWTGP
jgi:hypothetical protein